MCWFVGRVRCLIDVLLIMIGWCVLFVVLFCICVSCRRLFVVFLVGCVCLYVCLFAVVVAVVCVLFVSFVGMLAAPAVVINVVYDAVLV